MRTMNLLAVSLLFAASYGLGQGSASTPSSVPAETKPLAFDVVSIRPSDRTDGAWGFRPTSDGYSAMNVSLRKLIEEAYSKYDDKLVVGGPSWIDSANFDIQAKLPSADVDAAQKLAY